MNNEYSMQLIGGSNTLPIQQSTSPQVQSSAPGTLTGKKVNKLSRDNTSSVALSDLIARKGNVSVEKKDLPLCLQLAGTDYEMFNISSSDAKRALSGKPKGTFLLSWPPKSRKENKPVTSFYINYVDDKGKAAQVKVKIEFEDTKGIHHSTLEDFVKTKTIGEKAKIVFKPQLANEAANLKEAKQKIKDNVHENELLFTICEHDEEKNSETLPLVYATKNKESTLSGTPQLTLTFSLESSEQIHWNLESLIKSQSYLRNQITKDEVQLDRGLFRPLSRRLTTTASTLFGSSSVTGEKPVVVGSTVTKTQMEDKLYQSLNGKVEGLTAQELKTTIHWIVEEIEDHRAEWVGELVKNTEAEARLKNLGFEESLPGGAKAKSSAPSVYKTFERLGHKMAFTVEVKGNPNGGDAQIFVHLKKRSKEKAAGNFKKTTLSLEYGEKINLIALQRVKNKDKLQEGAFKGTLEEIEQEVEVATRFNGIEGCAQCLGYTKHVKDDGTVQLHILNEYYNGGGLDSSIRNLSKPQVLKIARDTATGLVGIHKSGHVHRDIHPGNILTKKDEKTNTVEDGVLGDFGLSTRADNPDWYAGSVNRLIMPPEFLEILYRGQSAKGLFPEFSSLPADQTDALISFPREFDVWALGMVFYEMRYRQAPPWKKTLDDEAKKVPGATQERAVQEIRQFRANEPDKKALPFDHLIWEMLNVDPTKRPTAEQVLERLSQIK